MSTITGTTRADKISGSDAGDVIQGNSGRDVIEAGAGDDIVRGGNGNDNISGGVGNDILIGSQGDRAKVDMNNLKIAVDTTARITFDGESAGYKNTLGMYKIAADGTITGVDILFANASLKGSGGDLVGGKSSVDVDIKAGDRVGFFVAPNAFAMKGMDKLLADEGGSFKMVDGKGNPATVGGGEAFLVHVSAKGVETMISTQYGNSIFHSVNGATGGLNGDHFNHVKGTVDPATGTIKVGFEDLWKGGDKDFDDSSFTVQLGATNAALLGHEGSVGSKHGDDDRIDGGAGADTIFGMAGHDHLMGGHGDDRIWGNSGNDVLLGGEGNDALFGGKGNDRLDGGIGNDLLNGGSGSDVLFAGEGDDRLIGGAGSDTLSFEGVKTDGVKVDLNGHVASSSVTGTDKISGVENVMGSMGDDTIAGDKRANVLDGGAGNDALRGRGGADTLVVSDGDDTLVWFGKDVVDAKGNHLGVDTVIGFGVGDVLDFSAFAKGDADSIAIKNGNDGAHVYATIDGHMTEVAVLHDFRGSVDKMLAEGMLLV